MLTADLIRARVVKGEVRPRYVAPNDEEVRALAGVMAETFRAHLGKRRAELDAALAELTGEGTDYLLHRGLAKLLFDRSTYEVRSPIEPQELRRAVFEASAKVHPAVRVADALHPVSRDDVLAQVAAQLGVEPAAVEQGLYADLEDEQVMTEAPDLAGEALVQRYNLALAQAALLRATKLVVHLDEGDPARYRQLFRWVKFYRLIHRAERAAGGGWMLTLDGPVSVFQQSNKYGLQLAEFLPALLLFPSWSAEAELRWGPQKREVTFRVSHDDELVSHLPDKGAYVTREEQWVLDRFAALKSPWTLAREGSLIDLDGRGVLIPDFVARHPDGREALVEVLGFWRKETLQARIELLASAGPKNLVLAVPWKLRGGAEDEATAAGAEALFFKEVIVAKELLERVERVGAKPAPGTEAPAEAAVKPKAKRATKKKG
ncbi:MAG: DUF790 family protein [Myxococcaceae bacterium]|nr:MAG: DUF790 family protein [Myxococcaceae bacterium]